MIRFAFLCCALAALGCRRPVQSDSFTARKEIKGSFAAVPERQRQLKEGYERITAGMSTADATKVLGEPDEILPLYEPQILNPKRIGMTYWYYFEKYGDDRGSSRLVRVSF